MPTIVFKKDGSAMAIYSKEELKKIMGGAYQKGTTGKVTVPFKRLEAR